MLDKDKYIEFEDLANDNQVLHLYTKIPFNFNKQELSKNYIFKEYEEIQKIFNHKFDNIIVSNQNHTTNVIKITRENINNNFDNVDGLITNLKNVALVTYSADCQSILIYDKKRKIIGNIHSGWKGTLNRIIENAINIMVNDYNSNREDISVFICPSILKCCFEVDSDVKDEFIDRFNDIDINNYIKQKNNKYLIDTVGINTDILINLGIKKENIHKSNICTKCSKEFHSYRRNKEINGRNIALIALI